MIIVNWALPSDPVIERRELPSIARIIEETCARYGFTRAQMISPRRAQPLARARQEAMYRCVKETPASYPEIGRAFGNRDHTTVIHAKRAHEARLARAAELTKNAEKTEGTDGAH